MTVKSTENIELIIQHFLQKNASDEEQNFLLYWLKENPENQKWLFGEKDIWEASQLGSEKLNRIQEEQWLRLQQHLSKDKARKIRFIEFVRIAAIVVIAIGAGWFGHLLFAGFSSGNHDVEMQTVEASKGQIKEIFLADGTHVWLNSDSKLLFPSAFTKDTREIKLQGEAFFEVTTNHEHPFLVRTKNHTVKVTGTRFNICEYPESKIIETTLVEGSVKIITGNLMKDIFPGQQSTFYTETAKIEIGEKDFEIYTAWKDGIYDFNNQQVTKIFQIMERWWDVKIRYPENKLKNERYSGVLRKHKTIEQHLKVIKQLIPIEYEIQDDLIIIK